MSRPQFSKDYRTYGEWLKAIPRISRYAKEIIRKHQYFPDKSLNDLRHLRIGMHDLSKVAWQLLSSQEKRDRNLSLQVLRAMRKGATLTQATEKVGVDKRFALKHLGTHLQKSGGRWHVARTDNFQSEMMFYDRDDGLISIVTTRSKDRSLIAEYFNAINKALKDGNPDHLKRFENAKVIDAEGKEHFFVTDLERLYEIQDAQEEPEFFELYV
ncbi:hypothetical protein [Methanococcoides alaskense]|uniref:Uncharacterized protein n=1 Tax=Methanococcoides alaskense TaxID=325778 RepID=A0AA90TX66_9EURY|nr:hypothetical protein [Methanococcoides alaskense]MDA0525460.1 hypothetical protein [Methanococcoides alaskense]MDR6221605.1 hypothetical protein [Methanococcoides alaskense]